MNKYGMICNKVHDTAVNIENFKVCLLEIKGICTNLGISDPILILDNARIHHYKGLNETISALDLRLKYLPSYCLFLNPTKNVFSAWKNLVIRAKVKSEREMKIEISKSFNIITNHCDSFYKTMLAYIVKPERRVIILD